MNADRAPWLVLGLGNELLSDEGLGVVAARALAAHVDDEVEVVDGATLGLGLLGELAGRQGVLVLDAVDGADLEPGAIVTIDRVDLVTAQRLFASAHDIGFGDALAAAELSGIAPRHVAVIGMRPRSLEVGVGLTPEIAARIDELVNAALAVLSSWQPEVSHA